MKISDLARRSGVTIPTIKYYIREGLLRPGDASAPNQARYDDQHLGDLTLIRALRDHAGLSIASIRRVFSAISAATDSQGEPLAAGVHSVESERLAEREGPVLDQNDPDYTAAWQDLQAVLAGRAWRRDENEPEVQELLATMVAVRKIWPYEMPSEGWARYADLGAHAASLEIPESWDPDRFPQETLRYAIVGTYLFEPVVLAFRRLALSERSNELQIRRRAENTPFEKTYRFCWWPSHPLRTFKSLMKSCVRLRAHFLIINNSERETRKWQEKKTTTTLRDDSLIAAGSIGSGRLLTTKNSTCFGSS